jgi:hypothetical protein
MTKCLKCGGTDITKGKIRRSSEEFFSDIIFGPEKLRFLTVALQHGTKLEPESYACLNCGTVWSRTDPAALRDFIRKHCKRPKDEKPKG